MEQLGEPQTHIGLKGIMAEVDEDADNHYTHTLYSLYTTLCTRWMRMQITNSACGNSC
jgi:hypothetical protein